MSYNLLYVFADQLSMYALNIYGNQNAVATPNMDRLARQGVRFTNSYCSTPQCSPSRSSLLTGLHPHKTGVVGNIGSPDTVPLSEELIGVGVHMQRQGFRTGYFGKWHLGTPVDRFGFDVWSGHVPNEEKDERTTRHAVGFIEQGVPGQPWLALVSYENPHNIYDVIHAMNEGLELDTDSIVLPSNFHDDLADKPRAQRIYLDHDQGELLTSFDEDKWKYYLAFYYRLVRELDEELGKLLAALESSGQTERTIIIFSSDHGDLMGAHRCPFKGPMMYDELIKVPLLISCPGLLPEGETRDQLTVNIDIFPTVCDLLGVTIPVGLDGRSIKPCLLDASREDRAYVVIQYHSKQKWVNPIRTIVNKEFKYNLYLSGEEELYAAGQEDREVTNLARDGRYDEVKANLKSMLLEWMQREGDPFFDYETTELGG
ncbi:sulfatase [Paenibacillus sp. YYML68]|uniref:sulfatase family protein n=1 Tax=Paenibacillus sp. YYML68 TaxID=2909250 RepID=UPI0024903699|nr:sulfatase-like hydrolase/transferase [Paenibacillus sp. YYML68]